MLPGRQARPCRMLPTFAMLMAKRGRSSVVEHQLPKLSVVGSIPIARSNKISHYLGQSEKN
jgi:hypothetical protein